MVVVCRGRARVLPSSSGQGECGRLLLPGKCGHVTVQTRRGRMAALFDALYLRWLPFPSCHFHFAIKASWPSPSAPTSQTSAKMSKLSTKSSASKASDTEYIYEPLPIPQLAEKLAGPPKELELTAEQEKIFDKVLDHFTAEDYQLPCEKDRSLRQEEKFWLVSLRSSGTIQASVTSHRIP